MQLQDVSSNSDNSLGCCILPIQRPWTHTAVHSPHHKRQRSTTSRKYLKHFSSAPDFKTLCSTSQEKLERYEYLSQHMLRTKQSVAGITLHWFHHMWRNPAKSGILSKRLHVRSSSPAMQVTGVPTRSLTPRQAITTQYGQLRRSGYSSVDVESVETHACHGVQEQARKHTHKEKKF